MGIAGLASPSGAESFNMALSERRAKSVVEFLRKEVRSNFAVELDISLGEFAARLAGLRDGVEAENWRAVVVAAWKRPVPPPVDPRPKCHREIWRNENGSLDIYTFTHPVVRLSGAPLPRTFQPHSIGKGLVHTHFCATDFEREFSRIVTSNYSGGPIIDNIMDPEPYDVVGHYVCALTGADSLFIPVNAIFPPEAERDLNYMARQLHG
jgi:hypothetical protein